jgi:hypothetical protein
MMLSPLALVEQALTPCVGCIPDVDIRGICSTVAVTLPMMHRPIIDEERRNAAISNLSTCLFMASTLIRAEKKKTPTTMDVRLVAGDGIAGPCTVRVTSHDDVNALYRPKSLFEELKKQLKAVSDHLHQINESKKLNIVINIVPGNGTAGIGSIWLPKPLKEIPEKSKLYMLAYTHLVREMVKNSPYYREWNYCGNGDRGSGVVWCG